MHIRLSGPRLLAINALGSLFGYWTHLEQAPAVEKYRAMTHEALLEELASQNSGEMGYTIVAGIFLVGAVVVVTDLLTRFFTAAWQRIEPRSGGQPSGEAAA